MKSEGNTTNYQNNTNNTNCPNIDKKQYEKMKVNQIVDNWNLNRISESELVVVKKLASGGQGKVKLGKYYDMSVIIKVLHDLNARDYTNEVVNMYKYRHPNIPKFLGIFDSDKDFGVVIEHVDGMTMSKIISMEKQGKLSLNFLTKIDYMIQLASVVDYLHDNHLIHRDLKPGNVIVDHLGNLMLLDFGIAIPESKNEIDMDSHDFCLTPTYITPEIAEQASKIGEEADKSDSEEENSSENIKENTNENIKENLKEELNFNEDSNNLNYPNDNYTSNEKNFLSSLTENSYGKRLGRISTKRESLGSNTNINITNFNINSNYTTFLKLKKPKRNIIKISNKCDVWTFGLILSELFTRCGPWAKNEKEKLLDYNITKYILQKKPYPITKIFPPGNSNELKLKEIIKRCTHYDPFQRATIKEIKHLLLEIFHNEVIESGKLFKLGIIKTLNNVHREVRQTFDKLDNVCSKNQIIRNNKIIHQRKNYSIEAINQINLQLNLDKLGNKNLDIHVTNDMRVIFSEHIKLLSIIKSQNSSSNNKNIFEIDNSLLEGLKKINLKRGQRKIILEHKKRELINKISLLKNKFGLKNQLNKDNNNLYNDTLLKTYFYMTFDEFNQNILIYEFMKKELKIVEFNLISKNLNYRNPFCINYNETLFMIGGLVINSGINLESVNLNRHSIINFHKENYDKILGANYIPTNFCFYFDPIRKEQKTLPMLINPRTNHSCIVFRKSFLWVIGGTSKSCEVLDIRNINSTKFEGIMFRNVSDLIYEMFNPLLMTFNNLYILAIEYEKQNCGNLNNKIKFQIYNHTTKIWNEDQINFDTKLNLEFFLGGYYNYDREDEFIIFANNIENNIEDVIDENCDDSKSNTSDSIKSELNNYVDEKSSCEGSVDSINDNKINLLSLLEQNKSSYILKFKLDCEGSENLPFFNFKLESSKQVNFLNPKHTGDFFKTPQIMQIHNSNNLYEFDEDLYYFTFNLDNTEVLLKILDGDLNNIH